MNRTAAKATPREAADNDEQRPNRRGLPAPPSPPRESERPAARGAERHYPDEIKHAAKSLFVRRYSVTAIAGMLSVPERTVYDWKKKGLWDDLLAHEGKEAAISRRIALLAERESKTPLELKELEALISGLERLQTLEERKARTRARLLEAPLTDGDEPGGASSDSGEATGARPARTQGRRGTETYNNRKRPSNRKPKKNDVSWITPELYREKVISRLFDYQREYRAIEARNAFILKSRQTGFTKTEAEVSFERAIFAGRNKNFLSATRAQAGIFRNYIVQCAAEEFDLELTGNPITLKTHKGFSELRFLSNNSKSAQGYHGDVVIDEAFWIGKFKELYKLATGMASHAVYQRRILSTPSALNHQAYPLWAGVEYMKRFKKPPPWPSFAELQNGLLCPDGWFRKIITLDDAIRGGCNLFDVAQLKLEYTEQEFNQLFMCQFIDDAAAVFGISLLESCCADPADWEDSGEVDFNAARPVGNRQVWGGYDPAKLRDDASFVVLLPPAEPGGEIKVIERIRWHGINYTSQIRQIKKLTEKYNFSHLAIDTTGVGLGVYEHVKQFLPITTPLNYSVMSKTALVLKAMEVMQQGRLKFDAADTAIAHAFMTIKQGATDNGAVHYFSSRNEEVGHGDAAWAIMKALSAEPLARQTGRGGVVLAFGD